MKKKIALLLAISLLMLPVAGFATTLVVNSETDPSKLDPETVELIYLGKKTLWGSGQRIVPVLVDEESAVSKRFLDEVLTKSVSQYRAYWKRRLFSGGGAVPKTFRTSSAVVEFVSKTPGAIGVVETGTRDNRVKVLDIGR